MATFKRRQFTKTMGYAALAIASGCTTVKTTTSTTPVLPTVSPAATSSASRVVRIGISKFGAMLNALRAQGTLEKQLEPLGLTLDWKEFVAGPQLMEALSVGEIDITYTGEPPPIFAQANGTPIVYLANERLGPAAVAVLVPKDSNAQSIADLKGKKIAMSKATNSQYLIIRALDAAGLKFTDITPVYLTPADGRIAFEGGNVDAWSTWDPFQAAAEQALGAKTLLDGKGFLPNTGYYLSTQAYADANAEAIAIILEEVQKINDWAAANPRELAELLSPKYGVSADVLEIVEKRREHGLQPINDTVIAEQQQMADIFLREKILPKSVVVKDAIWAAPK